MNSLLLTTILFIETVYAGIMGAQSDNDIYVYLAIICFLGMMLGILYLITFFRNKVKELQNKIKELQNNDSLQGDDIGILENEVS